MSVGRKIAIAVFAVFTLVCAGWLFLFWFSINLLSYTGCGSPENPAPCSEILPRVFLLQAFLPTVGVWSLVAWLTFRRWGKR